MLKKFLRKESTLKKPLTKTFAVILLLVSLLVVARGLYEKYASSENIKTHVSIPPENYESKVEEDHFVKATDVLPTVESTPAADENVHKSVPEVVTKSIVETIPEKVSVAETPKRNFQENFEVQKIDNSETQSTTSVVAEVEEKGPERKRKIGFIPGLEEWNLSALYGAKYVSLSQSGDFNDADFGVLFLNNIKLQSEFLFESWMAWFQIDTYKFKYEALGEKDGSRMNNINLAIGYMWAMLGLEFNQFPMFMDDNSEIQMSKGSLMSLMLGFRQDYDLPTRKPTQVKVKAWLTYPFSSSSSESHVDVKSMNGYGVKAQVELTREIISRPGYSLHAIWQTQAGYQNISQDLKWNSQKVSINSSLLEVSSNVGLQIKF